MVREALAGGVFGIKAGDVAAQGVLGFKAACFWPGNRALGGEPHQATIVLVDPETGCPLCAIDGNAVTTLRTSAAGGLGLQLLARPDSTRLCIFGTGVQARIQLRFALSLRPALRVVRYASHHGESMPAFEAEGRRCVGADTRGKRELPPGLLERARLFVDDAAQARQIGETQWSPQTPCTTLGNLLTGAATFTRRADEITVFDMTGLALQDLAVARMLYARATAEGLGTRVAWPW